MTDFPALLRCLGDAGVEFIVVGGAAATVHAREPRSARGDRRRRRSYEALVPDVIPARAFRVECPCLGIEKLIAVKRAAGRPKAYEAVAELEALIEERARQGG